MLTGPLVVLGGVAIVALVLGFAGKVASVWAADHVPKRWGEAARRLRGKYRRQGLVSYHHIDVEYGDVAIRVGNFQWSDGVRARLGTRFRATGQDLFPAGSFDTRMGRLEEAKGAGALAEHSALGRFGKVQEIAEVLAFCASDKPGYLTGTDILVDGGPGQKMSAKEMIATLRNL
jgi:hypothetical protein